MAERAPPSGERGGPMLPGAPLASVGPGAGELRPHTLNCSHSAAKSLSEPPPQRPLPPAHVLEFSQTSPGLAGTCSESQLLSLPLKDFRLICLHFCLLPAAHTWLSA